MRVASIGIHVRIFDALSIEWVNYAEHCSSAMLHREGSFLSRIVIVEDDFDLSRVIKDMLEDLGHEVVSYVQPSPDIPEHLKMYGADLLVVDARLNTSISGWEIIRAVRADPETEDLPIIVCSGAVDQIEDHRAELEAFGVPALVKPFDLDDLETLVNRMLKRESVA